MSLQEVGEQEQEVCHSALWLPGSDVFLYVPYSVFTVVAVRCPSASARAAGEVAEVSVSVCLWRLCVAMCRALCGLAAFVYRGLYPYGCSCGCGLCLMTRGRRTSCCR